MCRSRLTLALLMTGAFASGCDRETPVSPRGPAAPTPVPLVNPPVVTPDDLVASNFVVREADPEVDGPSLAELEGEDESRPIQQIFNAETRVGFENGYAYALGRHDYIGNVGSIRTTVHVAHRNAHLGSQTSKNQDYTPFLLDWGARKMIWTWARVYSDHECGLSAQGDSEHRAWWQFYQGDGVAEWGVDVESTQAAPEEQACSNGTAEGSATIDGSGGMVCYYLITYDMDTGQILNAELLYCTTSGPRI